MLTFSLEEVVGSPEFDGSNLPSIAHAPVELLAQFNETSRDKSPVRQFLGYFKILESLSNGAGGASHLGQALRAYSPLATHYAELQPNKSLERFIDRLVARRHKCAHLKAGSGFGYAPHDPAVRDEVIPQLALLEELTYPCLAGSPRLDRAE
ncbi:MAG TPA: methylamine utilization protein MauJ [Acidobacteriaceae bacterium]|nr:methylamine utilization protein MauJ [Acidobacteriaceae bacterium]